MCASTNFATFIDSTNQRAPIAQRGHAKQKRNDLRLVGLGLVVTRDGGIPLLSHAYPGDRPDVTQFPTMIKTLAELLTCAYAESERPVPARGPSKVTVWRVLTGIDAVGLDAVIGGWLLDQAYAETLPDPDPDVESGPPRGRRPVWAGCPRWRSRRTARPAAEPRTPPDSRCTCCP